MATITFRLSAKSDKETSKHEVLIRFRHGKKIDQYAKTTVFINPEYWSDNKQTISIPNIRLLTYEKKCLLAELHEQKEKLEAISALVQTSFQSIEKKSITNDWLTKLIKDYNNPKPLAEEISDSFFEAFNSYINLRQFSDHTRKHYRVVWRTMKRFELYKKLTLTFDNITPDLLVEFERFLTVEHQLAELSKYQKILEEVPESRTPQPRGKNSIFDFMKKLRSFFLWAINNDITNNNPFKHYKVAECVYGTPYYISIEERNHLYHFDLSATPHLAQQRDIFVFQCVIGCRVSDLWAMTKSNIINGAVEYIPRKTKEGRAVTVRVPLNSIALEIINKYKDYDSVKLFPLTSQPRYNIDIKKFFRLAGLTRMVTIINPTTREEEQQPLCDIASSHLARRCFIGNLYKQVKDPNLIAKLSGHKEGSQAFCRYRDIDEETSRQLVKMLE